MQKFDNSKKIIAQFIHFSTTNPQPRQRDYTFT